MRHSNELDKAKSAAKAALESLIAQCYDEIRNLERFEDDRMLIATGDLERRFNCAMEDAQELENTFNVTDEESRATI